MSDNRRRIYTAFAGTRQFANGALIDVALAVKAREAEKMDEPILVFDDGSGAVVDLDLRGTMADVAARLAEQGQAGNAETDAPGRSSSARPPRIAGRPKLGVIAREVTLLPRHWDWLSVQPGGASQTLRRLVDEARRMDSGQTRLKTAREAAYRFLSVLAGDLPGFEEAIRALFAGDADAFAHHMAAWPPDIRNHARELAARN